MTRYENRCEEPNERTKLALGQDYTCEVEFVMRRADGTIVSRLTATGVGDYAACSLMRSRFSNMLSEICRWGVTVAAKLGMSTPPGVTP